MKGTKLEDGREVILAGSQPGAVLVGPEGTDHRDWPHIGTPVCADGTNYMSPGTCRGFGVKYRGPWVGVRYRPPWFEGQTAEQAKATFVRRAEGPNGDAWSREYVDGLIRQEPDSSLIEFLAD